MKNYHVTPARQFVMTNDPLSQKLFSNEFSLPAHHDFEDEITESRRKRICSGLTIHNESDTPFRLNEFDRAVFNTVISEMAAGNDYTTPAMIYHDLGGDSTHLLPEKICRGIFASLHKMAYLRLTLDTAEAARKLRYPLEPKYTGRILNTASADIVIGGQRTQAIKIRGSVVFKIASAKNMIIRADNVIMNLNTRNTERVIAIKHYIFRRVAEISGSHDSLMRGRNNQRLTPTILYEELYKRCGFQNLNRWQEQDIRKIAAQILNKLIVRTLITHWNHGFSENGKITSIILDLTPPSCEKNNTPTAYKLRPPRI